MPITDAISAASDRITQALQKGSNPKPFQGLQAMGDALAKRGSFGDAMNQINAARLQEEQQLLNTLNTLHGVQYREKTFEENKRQFGVQQEGINRRFDVEQAGVQSRHADTIGISRARLNLEKTRFAHQVHQNQLKEIAAKDAAMAEAITNIVDDLPADKASAFMESLAKHPGANLEFDNPGQKVMWTQRVAAEGGFLGKGPSSLEFETPIKETARVAGIIASGGRPTIPDAVNYRIAYNERSKPKPAMVTGAGGVQIQVMMPGSDMTGIPTPDEVDRLAGLTDRPMPSEETIENTLDVPGFTGGVKIIPGGSSLETPSPSGTTASPLATDTGVARVENPPAPQNEPISDDLQSHLPPGMPPGTVVVGVESEGGLSADTANYIRRNALRLRNVKAAISTARDVVQTDIDRGGVSSFGVGGYVGGLNSTGVANQFPVTSEMLAIVGFDTETINRIQNDRSEVGAALRQAGRFIANGLEADRFTGEDAQAAKDIIRSLSAGRTNTTVMTDLERLETQLDKLFQIMLESETTQSVFPEQTTPAVEVAPSAPVEGDIWKFDENGNLYKAQ